MQIIRRKSFATLAATLAAILALFSIIASTHIVHAMKCLVPSLDSLLNTYRQCNKCKS